MTHYDCIPPKTNNKELNMTIDKNRIEIDKNDIQVGDLIRAERDDRSILATEWRVGINWTAPNEPPNVRYFLLDRPKRIKWTKGTTLWITEKGAKPLSRYVKGGDEVLVRVDHAEGDTFVDVVFKGNIHQGAGGYFPESFTDIRPEPHPVGATRWVTEDHKSVYGVQLRKGDEVVVRCLERSGFRDGYDIVVANKRTHPVYSKSKFLSATPVEPEPVFVSVRKDALDKLRADTDVAGWAVSDFLASVDG